MPESKCPTCNCISFRAVKYNPTGLDHEIIFIQCIENNHVVGVIDTTYIQRLLVEGATSIVSGVVKNITHHKQP